MAESAMDQWKNRKTKEREAPAPAPEPAKPTVLEEIAEETRIEAEQRGLELKTLADFKEFADIAVKAGIVGKKETEEVARARAIIAMQYGAEVNLSPIQSIRSVYVVNARPSLMADVIGALIQGSGKYKYREVRGNWSDEEECQIDFYERTPQGWMGVGRAGFTIAKAKRAGLTRKDTWTSYPDAMLWARALTKGARKFCPEIFGGAVYTPEELEDLPEASEPPAPIVTERELKDAAEKMQTEDPRKAGKSRAPAMTTPDKICRAFESLGVNQDDLVDRVGKSPDKWTEDDVLKLRAVWKAINAGETTAADEFQPPREPGQEG
jgi:hypothetical protein